MNVILKTEQKRTCTPSTPQPSFTTKLYELKSEDTRLKLQKEISPLMSPFSCRACSGGLFRISFFSRVFTLFLSVFSRLDVERGTAEGGKVNMEKLEEEREEEEEVSARRSGVGPESR